MNNKAIEEIRNFDKTGISHSLGRCEDKFVAWIKISKYASFKFQENSSDNSHSNIVACIFKTKLPIYWIKTEETPNRRKKMNKEQW